MIERSAPAKINLALHVTARRGDGYHEIDTLVGFADIGDRLRVERAGPGRITLSANGPFAAGLPQDDDDNIVLRAAKALAQTADEYGVSVAGAAITLEKNLPVASGIGGGSADAAATLVALRQLWSLPGDLALAPIGVRLGADVAMCLASVPLRATGIGEKIRPLAGVSSLHAVLVNPGIMAATPEVFAALKHKTNPPIGELPEAEPFDPAFLAGLHNDLQGPALSLYPVIGEVLELISRQKGCLLARMSGSGATCFGLFGDADQAWAARACIVDTAPHWWSVSTQIAGSPGDARGIR